MNYESVKKYILTRLDRELDPNLTYHSVSHTIDVLESAIRLAELENISNDDKILLQTACLFHDTGMLKTYRGHEEASVEIPIYRFMENLNVSAQYDKYISLRNQYKK